MAEEMLVAEWLVSQPVDWDFISFAGGWQGSPGTPPL
jgi:hypothetical protein